MNVFERRRARPASLLAGPDRMLLRLLIVLAPVGALTAAFAAGSTWSTWLLVVVVIGAITCSLHPDSHGGLGLIAVLVAHWLATVDDARTPWAMVAALCIAVFHAALAMAATAPPAARCTRETYVRWARRVGVASLAAVPMWAIDRGFTDADLGGSGVVLLVALLAVAGGALAMRARALR